MNVTFLPSVAIGKVTAPPSKSMAHRALLCGAMSAGSIVKNVIESEDIAATKRCLTSMGAAFAEAENGLSVGGLNPFALPENLMLDCGESGSTLRFLLPLCLLSGKKITLTGRVRLLERPLTIYEEICRKQGFFYEKTTDSVTVCGTLRPDDFTVDGGISSQFISGLFFALPLLAGESKIKLTGKIESAPYIEMTRQTLAQFGVKIDKIAENEYRIPGKQAYKSRTVTVEGDYTNAAYLMAWNALGGKVEVTDLLPETLQGDAIFTDYFDKIRQDSPTLDVSDCPDLAPILFALAGLYHGAAFTGTRRLRLKESDRVAAMKEELNKFGIVLFDSENEVYIPKATPHAPSEPVSGHNDHRIVMAASLLCGKFGGTIHGTEAVRKSFPDFFEKLRALNVGYKVEE